MIQKFVKRPIEVEAIKFTRNNFKDVVSFTKGLAMNITIERRMNGSCWCSIQTKEGLMRANEGDYIVREPFDTERGYYPVKPEIFEMTYESISK